VIPGSQIQVAGTSFGKTPNITPRPAITVVEDPPTSVFDVRSAGQCADPEASTVIKVEIYNAGSRELGGVEAVKDLELHTIEAYQPIKSAKP